MKDYSKHQRALTHLCYVMYQKATRIQSQTVTMARFFNPPGVIQFPRSFEHIINIVGAGEFYVDSRDFPQQYARLIKLSTLLYRRLYDSH